jgi:agmatinase
MGFGHGNGHHRPEGSGPAYGPEAKYAVEREAELPNTMHEREIARGLEMGLQGADSIADRTIPTFSRGELPHFAGINTFLKAPYVEDVRTCGEYDVAIVGVPFDGGTTYRSGTRFGPQGIRRISALYGPYSFELGVDLRESITMCDLGDIFVIPANIEKAFDQISKGVAHVFESGAFPIVLGGDHSRLPDHSGCGAAPERQPGHHPLRPACRHSGNGPGRAHAHHALVPRHRYPERATEEPRTDRDWRMAGTSPGVKVGRERGTTIMTVTDCVEMGIEEAAARALDVAWDGADAVWLSFDVDCLDAAFVPGTGWPEPGGFLPREVLKFIQIIADAAPLAGIEVVECSPPYDNAEITSLLSTRVICDTLGCLVCSGHLPKEATDWALVSGRGDPDHDSLLGRATAQQDHQVLGSIEDPGGEAVLGDDQPPKALEFGSARVQIGTRRGLSRPSPDLADHGAPDQGHRRGVPQALDLAGGVDRRHQQLRTIGHDPDGRPHRRPITPERREPDVLLRT